ncbi:hypothetical protein P7L91_09955 [Bisgaard Taxon 10/6]|uniref:hypothetical protein n=1 Tax=Exercitatus varius TaxID=67857 RepID=UPI00294B7B06|nr:hypothetical protein [Exercitatus varius]MDG2961155.1 hypothetical protein [Exercitatus varius]
MWEFGVPIGILIIFVVLIRAAGYLLGFYCLMKIICFVAFKFIKKSGRKIAFVICIGIPLLILYDGTVRHSEPLYLYRVWKEHLEWRKKQPKRIALKTLDELYPNQFRQLPADAIILYNAKENRLTIQVQSAMQPFYWKSLALEEFDYSNGKLDIRAKRPDFLRYKNGKRINPTEIKFGKFNCQELRAELDATDYANTIPPIEAFRMTYCEARDQSYLVGKQTIEGKSYLTYSTDQLPNGLTSYWRGRMHYGDYQITLGNFTTIERFNFFINDQAEVLAISQKLFLDEGSVKLGDCTYPKTSSGYNDITLFITNLNEKLVTVNISTTDPNIQLEEKCRVLHLPFKIEPVKN